MAKNVKMYTPNELISLKNNETNKYADFSQEEKDFQVSDDESRMVIKKRNKGRVNSNSILVDSAEVPSENNM